jgi:hypothetical protein
LDEIADELFGAIQNANDRRQAETTAVVRIQSTFRGSVVRVFYHQVKESTLTIQRLIRGKLGRIKTAAARLQRMRQQNLLFFNHCSTIIQKFFRGYRSRKDFHDYYARKEFLKKVGVRGDRTNKYLQVDFQQKLEVSREQEEQETRKEFDDLAGQLHHLVSTRTIPGVYNPPYSDVLPRAFDKPIEQHLRDSLQVQLPKSLRRPQLKLNKSLSPRGRNGYRPGNWSEVTGMTRLEEQTNASPPQNVPERQRLCSRTANAGRLQPIQGPFRGKHQIEVANAKAFNNFHSIQSSAPYDALEQDRKMHAKLEKLTRIAPNDFVNRHAEAGITKPSVHAETQFRDKPLEFRGEYLELPKIRDKPPFFCHLPRDKSFQDYGEQEYLPHSSV